jgi:hypothetical protein
MAIDPAVAKIMLDMLAQAARDESALAPFKLSGRGHERRVTLSVDAARLLRGIDIPKVTLSGFGPKRHYPRRVFVRAIAALERELGWSPLRLTERDWQVTIDDGR